ncbi:MAG TPA: pyrroline-5-carboxylate reductase [Candidatus Didemnitutus sp.]|nr:pyrroline-5-carboxylate reductase [Candidatus Didemnitutus sp.]
MARVAFIGAGKLATAIVRGVLARRLYAPSDLACTSKSGDSAARLAAATGIGHEPDLARLLGPADLVIVAFKPQSLATADPRLATLTAGKLVVSVLAGRRLARLSETFPQARNLVRAMPNTPAAIGAAMTSFAARQPLSDADRSTIVALLDALGRQIEVDEAHLDALTALGGSGPAFLFEFVAALRDAGIAAHLPPDVAKLVATQTVLGAAQLVAGSELTPEALRDQVTSPNGTTFAGLRVLSEGRFRDLIARTIQAATQRAGELARDS